MIGLITYILFVIGLTFFYRMFSFETLKKFYQFTKKNNSRIPSEVTAILSLFAVFFLVPLIAGYLFISYSLGMETSFNGLETVITIISFNFIYQQVKLKSYEKSNK